MSESMQKWRVPWALGKSCVMVEVDYQDCKSEPMLYNLHDSCGSHSLLALGSEGRKLDIFETIQILKLAWTPAN